jgi:hypothetical protein
VEHTARTLRGARGILVASASTIALATGVALTAAGLITRDSAQSASGASVIILALATIGLLLLRRWITDTSAERGRLATALADAAAERDRYIAANAAVEAERARVRRDAASLATQQRAQLAAEREHLQGSFERERERIATDAFRTGAMMERAGLLAEPQPATVTHIYAHRNRAAEHAHVTHRPS